MLHGPTLVLVILLGLALMGSGVYEIIYAYGNKTNDGVIYGVSAAGVVSVLLGAVTLFFTVR